MNAPRLGLRLTALHAFVLPLVAIALTLGASFALFSGCGLTTSGIPTVSDGGGCTGAAQCDDQNACTTDTCNSAGECVSTPVADGPAPASLQTQGNCKKILCTKGEEQTVADPTNGPKATDMCTDAKCNGETPEHTPKPDGTPCDLDGAPSECKGGKCQMPCTNASDCPSKGNCQTAACNGALGMCEYTSVSDGTPTPNVTPTVGNCHKHICLLGKDTDQVDDSNVPTVPAAMAGCADAECNSGDPSFPLHAPDSQCSTWMGTMAGFCEAGGNCSQCTKDSECAGTSTSDDCQHPGCTSGLCKPVLTPNGTATMMDPPQVPGDCQQIVCDGLGNTKMIADAADVPNDPSGCNPGTCTGTTPGHSQAPNTTPCGAGACGGMEACLNGVCSGCTMDCQCQMGGTEPNAKCNAAACSCIPFTCGTTKPGKTTCGAGIPDGCGGTLNCNDTTIDGNETDVDCGGASNANGECATRCPQGKKCLASSDCVSGLVCADGVCCNAACGGPCEACTAAKKQQGQDGVCGAAVAGITDPHGQCLNQAASTCGQEGTCNGSGACTTWPTGTQCQAPSCGGMGNNTLTEPETCVGGTCTAPKPANVVCAPYLCVGNNACSTSCAKDADCYTGNYCNGSVCVAKLATGTTCTASDQCTSNFCVSGFCCNNGCGGQCQACSAALTGGVNGTCGNVTPGMADPTNHCMISSPASNCGTDGNCASGGLCEKYGPSIPCGSPSCSGGMQMGQGACDGSGNCTPGSPTPCAPYACGATTCLTSCGAAVTGDSSCIATDYCDGVGAGTCHTKLTQGAGCSAADQCQSGHCVSGFCCNSACTAQCQACSAALTAGPNGTCGNVDPGTVDPSGSCAVSSPASNCGTDGKCTAGGGCEMYGASTVCIPASCNSSNNTQTTQGNCNGAGSCAGSSMSNCGAYVCGATACLTSCGAAVSGDVNCFNGDYCDGVGSGTCRARVGNGSACTTNDQCTSTFCVAGLCCNVACTGTCHACTAAQTGGTDGTCASVQPGGADPSGTCTVSTPASCGTDGLCAAGGVCEKYGASTACGAAASCNSSTNMGTPVGACNGAGVCSQPTTTCSPYVCGATACMTTCGAAVTGDVNCVPGDYCDGVGSGTCHTKLLTGIACTSNDQCASGGCAGGFCCAASCLGLGTPCQPTSCAAGSGACGAYAAALTSCSGGLTCSSNSVSGHTCDGKGTCQAVASYACSTFSGGGCTTGICSPCNNSSDCTNYGYCNTSRVCTPREPTGGACTGTFPEVCLSGTCTAGNTCQ